VTVERELRTLRELHAVLDRAAHDLQRVGASLDEAVGVDLWAGPQADRLRVTWSAQRDGVGTALVEALRVSVADVRTQHNNLAAATGEPDRL
jgi:GNAT superfamily N-acetyltransferase